MTEHTESRPDPDTLHRVPGKTNSTSTLHQQEKRPMSRSTSNYLCVDNMFFPAFMISKKAVSNEVRK